MKKRIEHRLRGYYMPEYLIDVLTGGYIDTFLPMSICRDEDAYTFSYDEGRLKKIDFRKMNSVQKLKLIKSLVEIAEKNNGHLIPDGSYALSPKTIYCFDGSVEYERVKLMYYPDLKGTPFRDKLSVLVNNIFKNGDTSEEELSKGLIAAIETNDINRVNRFLDKKMMRP